MSAEPTTDTPGRHIARELVFNLRDLGGYAAGDGRVVAWRRVLRADGIHRLDPAALHDLGIATVLDLRTHAEVDHARVRAEGIDWHHLPVLRTTWRAEWFTPDSIPERFLADRYLAMLEEGADALGAALRLLSEPARTPAVFHCAAGKDRTGVLAALLLSLLGVDDDTVVADYVLSAAGMGRMTDFIRQVNPERASAMVDQPRAFLTAPAEAMQLFLADLRHRHGSVAGYAATVGVTPDTVDALRDTLLVEPTR